MSQESLLHMSAPLREHFKIPVHDLGNRGQAPRAALVAGLHGNELNGIWVLSRLADFLKGLEREDHAGRRLKERVIVIPAVNVLGLNTRERLWPFDKTDINRMFPGYDQGETTQRIARAVLNATLPAYYRIDLHASNMDFEEMPQVRLYDASEAERSSAKLFGLAAVIERPSSPLFTTTLAHAWREAAGENFVIQAGYAGQLQVQHCERLFEALIKFLQRKGMIEGIHLAEDEEEIHHFSGKPSVRLVADRAGFFVTKQEVGQWVKTGDLLGFVYDGFEGTILAEIRSPAAGLLTGLRRQPLLCEGDLIARIHAP